MKHIKIFRFLFIAFAAFLITGCDSGSSAEKAYKSFVKSASKGDWESVYNSLTLESQRTLEDALKKEYRMKVVSERMSNTVDVSKLTEEQRKKVREEAREQLKVLQLKGSELFVALMAESDRVKGTFRTDDFEIKESRELSKGRVRLAVEHKVGEPFDVLVMNDKEGWKIRHVMRPAKKVEQEGSTAVQPDAATSGN